jgi:hydrogenase expression/formation protein HypD
MLKESFDIVDAEWRGVGTIPNSGFNLRCRYRHLDARLRYACPTDPPRKLAGRMPQGCECASVVLGRIYPNQCKIFGTACTPQNPVGPCMVSDEGACRIWWSAGHRASAA